MKKVFIGFYLFCVFIAFADANTIAPKRMAQMGFDELDALINLTESCLELPEIQSGVAKLEDVTKVSIDKKLMDEVTITGDCKLAAR